MGNFEAVVFFAIVAYLSTFFTKNMVIVFLISILATNFLMVSKVNYFRSSSKEGMENPDPDVDAAKVAVDAVKMHAKKKHAKKDDNKDETSASPSPSASAKPSAKPSPKPTNKASNTDKKKKEGMNGKLAPAKFNNDDDDEDDEVADSAPFASSSKSIEQAHDNLQKIGGMNTEEVMKQQKILMDNMKTMQPFLETAERFLDKFNMKGIDGLLGKIGLNSTDTTASSS